MVTHSIGTYLFKYKLWEISVCCISLTPRIEIIIGFSLVSYTLFIFDYFDFFLSVSQNEWYILYQYWTWYKISVHFLLFVHVSIIIVFRRLWSWIARSTCAWLKNVFHPTFFQYAIFFSQIKHLWSNTWVKKLVMIVHIFKLKVWVNY